MNIPTDAANKRVSKPETKYNLLAKEDNAVIKKKYSGTSINLFRLINRFITRRDRIVLRLLIPSIYMIRLRRIN